MKDDIDLGPIAQVVIDGLDSIRLIRQEVSSSILNSIYLTARYLSYVVPPCNGHAAGLVRKEHRLPWNRIIGIIDIPVTKRSG